MPTVSIIIPVYNVGKYIENSIKSVCAQSFKDFEVLLVDNNTPDDSIEIAERILKDNNIEYRVVKQTIQGLPAARNMGIEEAHGEWIVSIDPDDTISHFFLEELYNAAILHDLNIVFSKYNEVTKDNLFDFPQEKYTNCFLEYSQYEITHLLLIRKLPLMVSNMFFRKSSFIKNNIKFDEEVLLGADLMELWEILIYEDRVGYIDKFLYNHYLREDSLMSAPSDIKVKSNLDGYKRILNRVYKKYDENFIKLIYARAVLAILNTLSQFGDYALFKNNYDIYYDDNVYNSLKLFPDFKIRVFNSLMKLCPFIYNHFNKLIRRSSLITKWRLNRKINRNATTIDAKQML